MHCRVQRQAWNRTKCGAVFGILEAWDLSYWIWSLVQQWPILQERGKTNLIIHARTRPFQSLIVPSNMWFCLFQTAQTVLLVVAVFLISWLPHHIITMWAEFGQFPLNNISFTFRIISHCLAYGNSCINPIIYAFLSENFRKACRQVFTCKFLLQPAPAEKLVRIRLENFSTTHSTTNVWSGYKKRKCISVESTGKNRRWEGRETHLYR